MALDRAFEYRSGELHCEDVPVRAIADEYGTPCYVYSASALKTRLERIRSAFAAWDALVCFSAKSCSNVSILKLLAKAGSGFDICSGGELYRALLAGADPGKIVFAGVGKTPEEIEYALQEGILMFDVESRPELEAINEAGIRLGLRARVAVRVNPDVDPHTHEKITTGKAGTKFGIDMAQVEELVCEAAAWPGLTILGIQFHLGSQILSTEPYERALAKVAGLVERLRKSGVGITHINMGGGYGISYTGEQVVGPENYAVAAKSCLEKLNCAVIIEPGRYIAGNSAVLLTQVIYRKETASDKRFLICDAAMNDFIRPTLYGAFHRIWPVRSAKGMPAVLGPEQGPPDGYAAEAVDVVGPVCETGDFLAQGRPLPPVEQGELLAVFGAGAYGFSMSSNYNARPRAAEVLVDGSKSRLIRRRESYEDLVEAEKEFL